MSSAEDGQAPDGAENEQFICKFEKVRFDFVFFRRKHVHSKPANVF